MKKILSLFVIIFIAVTCQNKITKNAKIDDIINRYDQKDFSYFKDIIIAIRSVDRSHIIYILDKAEGNFPVYFVEYNLRTGKIDINRTNFEKANKKDYFTDDKIKEIIEKFRKYDLYLIKVDKENNLYINPFNINEPPALLRLAQSSKMKEIKKGFVYKHYKNNWYIRK